MIGVATFAYPTGHLTIHAADQGFGWQVVSSQIARRTILLTIGFATLLLLAVLAATSTRA